MSPVEFGPIVVLQAKNVIHKLEPVGRVCMHNLTKYGPTNTSAASALTPQIYKTYQSTHIIVEIHGVL